MIVNAIHPAGCDTTREHLATCDRNMFILPTSMSSMTSTTTTTTGLTMRTAATTTTGTAAAAGTAATGVRDTCSPTHGGLQDTMLATFFFHFHFSLTIFYYTNDYLQTDYMYGITQWAHKVLQQGTTTVIKMATVMRASASQPRDDGDQEDLQGDQ